jgi:hypothetical protein
MRGLAIHAVDPSDLIGERISTVVVGWHVYGSDRSSGRLFFRLENGIDIEAHTKGDGSLELLQCPVPADFSMDEYGKWEFRAVAIDHPAARLVGQRLATVERIRWRDTVVGLRLGTDEGIVVLANEADEVFASDGALPPDYADATIG